MDREIRYTKIMALVDNKKAGFNYEFVEKYEAGIELTGSEVKSLRLGRGSLEGSYVGIRGQEAFLLGSFIPPYQPANLKTEHDPYRPRRLLLTRAELESLIGQTSVKGLTIIPLSMYNKGKRLKLSLTVAKAKKKFDKREVLKKRDAGREIARELRTK